MVTGFMAGVALGQKLVGMNKKTSSPFLTAEAKRLQSAKLAALRRMNARKLAEQKSLATKKIMNEVSYINSQQGRRSNFNISRGKKASSLDKTIVEDAMIDAAIDYELKDTIKNDPSGQLLKSIRNSIRELNYWIKEKTAGLLDLNVSLAIFFAVRGIRKFVMEKQYPSAWQLIWWASSIMRGWRFM